MLPKQVIIIRKDLKMRRGKECSQAAHASMKVILDLMENVDITSPSDTAETIFHERVKILHMDDNKALKEWLNGSFKKIVVYVNSEDELLDIYSVARSAGLLCSLIKDNGHTEFNGVPTYTAVAIGPDYPENIDPITKDLPLL